MKKLLLANPDGAALLVLVALLLIPGLGMAHPRYSVMLASNIEVRGQQVWERLENRMHQFEERFNRVAVPETRKACLGEVSSD